MCAAAIWRATTITFNMTDDAHGDLTPFATEMCVAFAECNGAIICAAVPAMAKFLAQYLAQNVPRYVGSLKSTILSARRPSSASSAPSLPAAERRPAYEGYGYRGEKSVGPATDGAEVVQQPAPTLMPPPGL